jgi:hypothetical protein
LASFPTDWPWCNADTAPDVEDVDPEYVERPRRVGLAVDLLHGLYAYGRRSRMSPIACVILVEGRR